MKKLLFFVAAFLLVSLSSCHQDKKFTGYVPIGTEPKIEFVKAKSLFRTYYNDIISIEVICGKNKIIAHFDPGVGVINREYIDYHNTYPLSKGKLIYIEGGIDEKGVAHIHAVSLDPMN